MDTPKITLAVYGNQHSNSGFQPLYWINNPERQLENLLPPGMGQNPYYFVVETGTKYTQFTLIENNVSSYDGFRAGVLKMAIGIPNDYRLTNNESPMNVLLDIRKTFIEQCMTKKSSLSLTRNFKDELPDEQMFKDILNKYSLMRTYDQVYPMQGTEDAVILLSSEQTTAFFSNVHYPELAGYKRLVVGEKGNTENYAKVITGLTIPRPFTPPPVKPQQDVCIPGEKPHTAQASRVYVDLVKKPNLMIPITKYVIIPIMAFLLGVLTAFILSLFIY